MKAKKLQIKSKWGLHARPAGKFIRLANEFNSDIYVERGGEKANGKSILDLLSLALECGSWVNIVAEGEDEEDAIEKIENFLSKEGI